MNPTASDAAPDAARLLADVAHALGDRPTHARWRDAVRTVPREEFVPDRVWVRDTAAGGYAVCDRRREPERWRELVWSDVALVTRLTEHGVPTSSISAPSTVLWILEQADDTADSGGENLRVDAGPRVLEIGTGSGYHAALLAASLGADRVTSVEIDPGLARTARAALGRAGYGGVRVVCGDGAEGYAGNAPYDRVIATCAVRAVPDAWLRQTSPGAVIVTPWDSAWLNYGTLTLVRGAEPGTAAGGFAPYGSYMALRGQRSDATLADVFHPDHVPERGTTRLSPWAVAGAELDAVFAVGLAVPDVWHSWDTTGAYAPTRLWLVDDAATSWAAVDEALRGRGEFAVQQWGARRLWDEVRVAHERWVASGRPSIRRHRLYVRAGACAEPG